MDISRKISSISLVMLFILSTLSSGIDPMKEEMPELTIVSNTNHVDSWESMWTESEPVALSSEYGGGPSITTKWLAGQKQIQECIEESCPQISSTASEWLERDSLTLLLMFNRPGPSLEIQEKLLERNVTTKNLFFHNYQNSF